MDAISLLELAIAIALVYAILSLIATAASEALEAWISLRSRNLRDILENLLGPEGRDHLLHADAYVQPLMQAPNAWWQRTARWLRKKLVTWGRQIRAGYLRLAARWRREKPPEAGEGYWSLMTSWAPPPPLSSDSEARRCPSYLPPAVFAEATLRMIYGDDWRLGLAQNRVQARATALLGSDRLQQIRSLLAEAGDAEAAIQRLARWFDHANDRAYGWYRRRLNRRLLGIGLLLALGANADSVQMFKRLSDDPELRRAAVAQAQSLAAQTAPRACSSLDPQRDAVLLPQCLEAAPLKEQTVPAPAVASAVSAAVPDPAPTADPTPVPAVVAAAMPVPGSAGERLRCGSLPRPWPEAAVRACLALPAAAKLYAQAQAATALCPELQQIAQTQGQYSQQQLVSCLSGTLEPFVGWVDDPLTPQLRHWYARGAARWQVRGVPAAQWLLWPLLVKFAGLLMTAIAVSLGAPFWFDLLQNLVKLRSSLAIGTGTAAESPSAAGGAAANPAATAESAPGSAAEGAAAAPSGTLLRTGSGLKGYAPLALGMDLINADWCAWLAQRAYDTDTAALQAALLPYGLQCRSFDHPASRLNEPDTNGYLAWNDSDAFLVFRGTEKKLADWLTDAHLQLIACPLPSTVLSGARLHSGFATALAAVWQSPAQPQAALPGLLQPILDGSRRLWLCGHSLGAALAELAAVLLAEQLNTRADGLKGVIAGVYTYGSPRVGDGAFAAALEQSCSGRLHRFVNHRDLVARVPPATPGGYAHAGILHYFDELGRLYSNPQGWHLAFDTLFVTPDTIRDAVPAQIGDHLMNAYRARLAQARRSRALAYPAWGPPL